MKKYLLKPTPLLLLFFTSCGSMPDASLDTLTEIYDGGITLEYGFKSSASDGNQSYVKLVAENNSMVQSGWLSPEGMANNCAVLFTKANPQVVAQKDFLEVEINNGSPLAYQFNKDEIATLANDHDKAERLMAELVSTVRVNDIPKAVAAFAPPSGKVTRKEIETFLNAFQTSIPQNYKSTKLIGYRKTNDKENTQILEGILITQDSIHKMIMARLVSNKEGLKFNEIIF